MKEPIIQVGIVSGKEIPFILNSVYEYGNKKYSGNQAVQVKEGRILFHGQEYDELAFKSENPDKSFYLTKVTIGINFHWEKAEKQKFRGDLKFIIENGIITAINLIPLEQYISSVISSEMNANASKELLKAHAVISRSWLLSQLRQKGKRNNKQTFTINENERIVWADREDHKNFDVCADDHCQRYQGITKISTKKVNESIDETKGQVLKYDSEICDTRFSKCCGGITEEFQNCWEDTQKKYMQSVYDSTNSKNFPDLTIEKNAKKWILSTPDSFCNTTDKNVLKQILNSYDTNTKDFYRWKTEYSAEELSSIIKKKSGIDFGLISDLIPVERGKSGRLVKIKIVGSKKTMIIGKELEIRKYLSPTHLYSSAFITEKRNNKFILHGAGWGHGTGLCQIGAAMMGEKGYNYRQILSHYYPETELITLY